jgi:hypothetical protein
LYSGDGVTIAKSGYYDWSFDAFGRIQSDIAYFVLSLIYDPRLKPV